MKSGALNYPKELRDPPVHVTILREGELWYLIVLESTSDDLEVVWRAYSQTLTKSHVFYTCFMLTLWPPMQYISSNLCTGYYIWYINIEGTQAYLNNVNHYIIITSYYITYAIIEWLYYNHDSHCLLFAVSMSYSTYTQHR